MVECDHPNLGSIQPSPGTGGSPRSHDPPIVKESSETVLVVAQQNGKLRYKHGTNMPISVLNSEILDEKFLTKRVALVADQFKRSGCALTCVAFGEDGTDNGPITGNRHAGNGLAQFIRNACRSTDVVGRYQGDSVLLVLPEANYLGGWAVAKRLTTMWKMGMVSAPASATVPVLKAGLATLSHETVQKVGLLQLAHTALSQALYSMPNICIMGTSQQRRPPELEYVPPVADWVLDCPELVHMASDHRFCRTLEYLDRNVKKAGLDLKSIRRVAERSLILARKMGFTNEQLITTVCAAFLRDIGMISVPGPLLARKGPLDKDDQLVVHLHPCSSVNLTKHFLEKEIQSIILHHHERMDGCGYPAGLRAEHIPIASRLIAVVDAFDAMTSERIYRRRTLTQDQARQQLEACAGTQFDPEVVNAFLS